MQFRTQREVKIAYVEGALFTLLILALASWFAHWSVNWAEVLIWPAFVVILLRFFDFVVSKVIKHPFESSLHSVVGVIGAGTLFKLFDNNQESFLLSIVVFIISYILMGQVVKQINEEVFNKKDGGNGGNSNP